MHNADSARRACFAIAAKLFSDSAPFWHYIRNRFRVGSLSDLDEQAWVLIEARLCAARDHRSCRDALFCELERGEL